MGQKVNPVGFDWELTEDGTLFGIRKILVTT